MRVGKSDFGKVVFAVLLLSAVVGFGAPVSGTGAEPGVSKTAKGGLAEDVRHQLIMLPYYGAFDNLQFEIKNDNTVELSGEVVRPILKSDAANAIRNLTGVDKVVNNIEVLPLSTFDDRIRIAEYFRIFGSGPLDRYSLGPNPSIRIIVRNGRVTLEGVVASETDRNVAALLANGVPAVFSVTNNLIVKK